MKVAMPICRRLFMQDVFFDFSFAAESAGRSRPARIAMMAMTTSSSISVNANLDRGLRLPRPWSPGGIELKRDISRSYGALRRSAMGEERRVNWWDQSGSGRDTVARKKARAVAITKSMLNGSRTIPIEACRVQSFKL